MERNINVSRKLLPSLLSNQTNGSFQICMIININVIKMYNEYIIVSVIRSKIKPIIPIIDIIDVKIINIIVNDNIESWEKDKIIIIVIIW